MYSSELNIPKLVYCDVSAYGGLNGMRVADKTNSTSTTRGANGNFGVGGRAGGPGATGDAGAGGSPNHCEKGQLFIARNGIAGTVNTTYC